MPESASPRTRPGADFTEDPRQVARRALEVLRDRSLCGSCKQDYGTMIDALDRDAEFEDLMRQYVAAEARHRRAAQLPERAAQITAARDEVARRLGAKPPSPPVHAHPRLLQFRPTDLRDMARSWREDLAGTIPHPLGILPDRPRRKA